ncbi:metal-dependent hydrolase [Natrialba taiwanensis]|uniref:Membrane-bound metal-dependent hydrolase n=1 Tax=Natrialba taiwanensis DSM 12281 TaxID=1230458 RepID=M0ADY9_9EURY|nr:metal-dependent hydrolase [Natrialba taiwanensis]ELY96077.1 membrane-bound metal-dependent hydrolase [Natrialba taiwanensis DSM 12281]
MYRGGHAGFNALLYAPFVPLVARTWSLELAILGAVIAIAVANLPDIDQPLPWLHHRGPTHTLWFAILIGIVAGIGTALVVSPTRSVFMFGCVVGTASILAHLAGDIVTPMGLTPLSPLTRKHVTLNWFKSKNSYINRVVLLIGTAALSISLIVTLSHSL